MDEQLFALYTDCLFEWLQCWPMGLSAMLSMPDNCLFLEMQAWMTLFRDFQTEVIDQPDLFFKAQQHYLLAVQQMTLATCQLFFKKVDRDATPEQVDKKEMGSDDKRFSNPDWYQHPWFSWLRQLYFLMNSFVAELMVYVKCWPAQKKELFLFGLNKFQNALAPQNTLLGNPEVFKQTIAEQGVNLLKGFRHFLQDLRQHPDIPSVRLVPEGSFAVGKTVAVTAGHVVFQNELIELIRYHPTTDSVYQTPLLICPPWINKFYILDLQQHNSLVKHVVDQGFIVYLISWRNPSATLDFSFEDYLLKGLIAAGAWIEAWHHQPIHVFGFCVGGTLLACALAYIAQKNSFAISSATFLTTLIDFSIPGELGLFANPECVDVIKASIEKKGYLDGRVMMLTFSLLRDNDLIWNYFINNYLKGQDPFPFDLLFWNSDSANLSKSNHLFYLKHFYQENALIQPGKLELGGIGLSLKDPKWPCFFVSALQDHIAPWQGVYQSAQALASPDKTFVLSGSGHVAGVVNPPAKQKYSYQLSQEMSLSAEAWLAAAPPAVAGSWWPAWWQWLVEKSSSKIAVSKLPNCPCLRDAPGEYVR